MGHAKISMTYDLYGHLFDDPEADREAMKRSRPLLLQRERDTDATCALFLQSYRADNTVSRAAARRSDVRPL
jgi:hypothetical protein